jgi:hypothetical protein
LFKCICHNKFVTNLSSRQAKYLWHMKFVKYNLLV